VAGRERVGADRIHVIQVRFLAPELLRRFPALVEELGIEPFAPRSTRNMVVRLVRDAEAGADLQDRPGWRS
jgi:hypothetical protein